MATEPVKDTDPTIGKLVADASRDISTLVSKEIQLAKSELKVSVRAGGLGIALFAAAGFIAVLAIIMLSVAIAYLIHWNGSGLSLHWAFLIVFGFYLLLGRPARLHRRQEGQAGQAARRRPSSRAARSRARSRARADAPPHPTQQPHEPGPGHTLRGRARVVVGPRRRQPRRPGDQLAQPPVETSALRATPSSATASACSAVSA